MQRLAFDDELRNDPRWPSVGIYDGLVRQLREAIAGKADDAVLTDLVGAQIERFRAAGNLDAAPGSNAWRVIARALCSAELEALERVSERDEGDFTRHPWRADHQERPAPGKGPCPGEPQGPVGRVYPNATADGWNARRWQAARRSNRGPA